MDLLSQKCDYDSQAAEALNLIYLGEPGKNQARFICTFPSICSIKANPSKDGDAKPWIYSHRSVTMIARPPKTLPSVPVRA